MPSIPRVRFFFGFLLLFPGTVPALAEGLAKDPLETIAEPAVVLVFVDLACPTTLRYLPRIERLSQWGASRGIAFYNVFPNPHLSADEVDRFCASSGLSAEARRDPDFSLTRRTGVGVTPQAVVLVPDASAPGYRIAYRGRIDDGYLTLSREDEAAVREDLKEVLEAVLSGADVPFRETRAVGSYIWRHSLATESGAP